MHTCQQFDYPSAKANGDNGPILDTPPSVLNIPQWTQPKPELKYWPSLKILTKVQLAMAILMVFFEAILIGVISNNLDDSSDSDDEPPREMGILGILVKVGIFGISVGILGVITAGLGIGAFWTIYGNKCLMRGHFVMCIIGAIADGILIQIAIVRLSLLAQLRDRYHYRDHEDPLVEVSSGVLASGSLLLIAALTHFVTSIVTSAFICRNWCCGGGQQAVAAVYLPGSGAYGKEATACGVEIPTGAQVVFPSVGGQQAPVYPTTVYYQ